MMNVGTIPPRYSGGGGVLPDLLGALPCCVGSLIPEMMNTLP
jgi:hypothetical protein